MCPICKGDTKKVWLTLQSPTSERSILVHEIHCEDKDCGMTFLPLTEEVAITEFYRQERDIEALR